MHTLTHNMFHAIYATAKILQNKGEKGETRVWAIYPCYI
jgi:hypothetical protein